jgi:hypothetical protein
MRERIKASLFFEILLHLLFWAFITALPLLSGPPPFLPHNSFPMWNFMFLNLLLAMQFYLNAFYLIPVWLNKKKQPWAYFLFALLSFLLLSLISIYTRPHIAFAVRDIPPIHPPFSVNFGLLPLAAITAAAFAYRYLADQFRQINNKHNIANAALVSELAFLRSQISPHFIFNVLNNVVALSRVDPPSVEPTLMELSQLLRYMLYVTDEAQITMGQKAEYLRSYIRLQGMRFGNEVNVDLNIDIKVPEKTIEPMLLVPFVENAFKHGTGNVTDPEIIIFLLSDKDMLHFRVRNKYNPNDCGKDDSHGIGLNNVKRRLALLYPGLHRLSIELDEHNYSVNLQIQFK